MAELLETAKVLLAKYVTSLNSMPHSGGHNINLSRINFIHIMHQKSEILITLKSLGRKKRVLKIYPLNSACVSI